MKRATALAAIVLLWAACSGAVTIPLEVVAPCTNEDSTPLTDLLQLEVYGQRCGSPDSVRLGVLPAAGAECDTIRFDLEVDAPGAAYELWCLATDSSGNRSKRAVHYSLTIPWSEYAPGQWGAYFADTSLTVLRYTRTDPNIDFIWHGEPAPGVPADFFSVRWQGRLRSLWAGDYGFRVRYDGGVRLWVAGVSLVNQWEVTNSETTPPEVSIPLAEGVEYDLILEYRDTTGTAEVILYWRPPGSSMAPIPASAFVH